MASKKKSAVKKESGVDAFSLDATYKALFESSQDAIMLLDRERFFDCNPATLKMFGLTKEIFIKLHPSEISPPRQANGLISRSEADRMIEEAFAKGSSRFEWIHRRSNGEDFPVIVWLTAFQVGGRDVLQATVREISLKDETQMDLEAQRLTLQSLLDQRTSGLKKESHERKRAESELKRLIKAVETSFNAIALFDMDMNFIYANQAFYRMAAIDSGKLGGMTARDFIPDESVSIIMENIQKNIAGEEIELFEVRTHDSQGKEMWVEIAGSVLFDDDGEPEGLLAIINDITERRRFQAILLDRSKILEAMSEGIMSFSAGGTVTDVNPAYERITGFSRSDVIGKNGPEIAAQILDPKLLPKVLKAFQRVVSGENVPPMEVDIKHKDGRTVSIILTTSRVGGSPDGNTIIAVLQDISVIKSAQKALRESEEKFKTLVERSLDGILIIQDGKVVYMNPALLELSGYSVEEQIGKDFIENVAPEERRKVMEMYRSRLEGKDVSPIYETTLLSKDGGRVPMEVNAAVMEYGGRPADFVYLRDLTQRRKAEEALKSTELMLREVLDNIPARVFWKDLELNYLGCNMNFARDSGLKHPDELLGKDDYQMGWREQADLYRADDMAVIKSGKPKIGYEEPQTTPDGGKIWLRTNKVPLKNTAGETIGVLGTYEDITIFKKADEESRRLKEQFEYVLGATNTGFDLIDEDLNLLYVDPKWVEKLGNYSGKKCHDYFMGLDRQCKGCAIPKALNTGKTIVSEEFLVKEKRYIEVHTIPLKSYGNKKVVAEFNIDITERKRMMNTLQESEEKFRNLAEYSPNMIFINKMGRVIYANKMAEQVMGYTREEFESENFNLDMIIHKDCHDMIRRNLQRHFKGEDIPPYEYKLVTKNGKIVDAMINTKTIDYGGDKAILGIVTDVSGLKKAEESIRDFSEQLKSLNDNLADGMVYQLNVGSKGDRNETRLTYISPAVERLHDLKPEDAIKNPTRIYAQIVEEDRNRLMEAELNAFATMGKVDEEVRVVLPSGEMRWRQFISAPRKMPNGDVVWDGIELDVTERKNAGETLRNLSEQLQGINENLADGMVYQINSGPDGKAREFSYLSPAVERLHGIKVEEAMKDPSLIYGQVIEEDREMLAQMERNAFESMTRMDAEVRVKLPSGEIRWRQFVSVPGKQANGDIAWDGIELDITDKKEVQQQLADKEMRYKELANGISSGVAVYQAVDGGKDFEIIDFNRAAEQIEKTERRKVIGKRVTEAFPGIKNMGLLDVLKRVWKSGKPENFPITLYKDERLNSWRENYVYKLPSGEIVAVYDDVTEKKSAEDKLRESEVKYRTLTEKANDAIFLADTDTGILIDVNDKACILTGRPREELIGMHQSKLHPPKDVNNYMQIFKEHVKKGTAINEEIVVQRKDGSIVPVSISASVFELHGKRVNQGIFHDLTDIVEAERVRREADEKARTIFSAIQDLIFGFDKDGVFISYTTPKSDRLFLPPETFIGKRYSEVMPPNVTKLLDMGFKKNRNGQTIDFEYPLNIGEEERWFSAKMSPIFADGAFNGSVAVVRDMTDRKRTEVALKSSREQLNALFQASTNGIGVEVDGKLFFVNPSFVSMFGYSGPEELIDLPLSTVVAPQDRKRVKGYSKLRLSNEAPPRYEFKGLRKDGSTLDTEASVSVYQIDKKNYYVGFVQNITDRKRAERHLHESEARFRRMAENIHDGLTIIENGKAIYVNERAVEIYGYPREELMNMTQLDLIIPEDREPMRAIIENAGKNNQRLGELEFWVQRKDGSRRYIRTRISTSQEDENTNEFIITTDITARKQAEDENKRRLMKFLLEDGRIYMVKEFRPGISVDAFNDLLNLEYFGLVLSRTQKKDLAKAIRGPFEHLWLGERAKGDPFEEILSAIGRVGGKSAVLIDRLDYLIFKYGFEKTLNLIFKLRDMIYLKEQVVIISMDTTTMKEDELNIMQKEMSEIEQRQAARPDEELFEIVQSIYEKNSSGIKPSYSEIGEELKLSKPTFRKRVRRLINAGYAVEVTKGNRKVLELTQKGRSLFFK